MRIHVLLLFIIISEIYFGQNNPGARQIGLSNSDVGLSNDVFAVFNNPAGLAQLRHREAGFYYSPAPFGMSELASINAAYNEPLTLGSAAIGFMTYGFELYRENKIFAAYSLKLSQLFIGLSVTFNNVAIKNYGTGNALSYNAGALVRPWKVLSFGFLLQNISKSTIGKKNNQIPAAFLAGISIIPTDDLNISLAIEKNYQFNTSWRGGLEYILIKYIILRAGLKTDPKTFSYGAGIVYDLFRFDYAVVSHEFLGLTHQIGIVLCFSELYP